MVVDRFKVNPGIALRLAESFETALGLAEGLATISYMDGDQPDQVLSAKFACTVCNYSLNELEPRLFSFNNPAGACNTCDGLGVHQYFDIDQIVQHPSASISEGAIRGWDRRTLFYFNMLSSLADHYNFDINQPWEQLPERGQHRRNYLQSRAFDRWYRCTRRPLHDREGICNRGGLWLELPFAIFLRVSEVMGRSPSNRRLRVFVTALLWLWVLTVFAIYMQNYAAPIRLMFRALFD